MNKYLSLHLFSKVNFSSGCRGWMVLAVGAAPPNISMASQYVFLINYFNIVIS